jgi:branched-subunit amino acid ABC-type transport system permease component
VNLILMLVGLVLSILVAQRKRPALSWAALAALAALGLVAPLLTRNLLTLTTLFIAGTAAIGWNIIGGFTGYASFGQSAFFGLLDQVISSSTIAGVQLGALKEALIFLVMVGILVVRPTGLLGKEGYH